MLSVIAEDFWLEVGTIISLNEGSSNDACIPKLFHITITSWWWLVQNVWIILL